MLRLCFQGDQKAFIPDLKIVKEELGFELSDDGIPILLTQRPGSLMVKKTKGHGEIIFQEKIHLFRGLGLWLEQSKKHHTFTLEEHPQFSVVGAMLDASRNAVMEVSEIKALLREMAVMGLSHLMVYTEDTYEVKDYPYFGYMRGRYTEEELYACDQYAQRLGIEMIPCIQTLAHLTEALKWNYALDMKDTADILLVDEPKTYAFLEQMIESVTRPFQSKRIHIGMDEAHQLGRGKYLDKHGYKTRFQIMNDHLHAVVAITEKFGLQPMIWSDMYFRLGSSRGDYYDEHAQIPEVVIQEIPDVELVYWDYYHTDPAFYQKFFHKHQNLKPNPIFAGGAWTWNGIAPNYGKAIATSEAALKACKSEGIKEVVVTMWGDNGAETPLTTALPILQLYAEHAYHENVTLEQVKERFQFCVEANWDDFLLLNAFDETPGVSENNLAESNPSKLTLWQDPLIGLYDENIAGFNLEKHYKDLANQLRNTKSSEKWDRLFRFYEQLATVLSTKANLGLRIKDAYEQKQYDTMVKIMQDIDLLMKHVDDLRKRHRTLWFAMNKPFGWEVLDIRYGGVLTRLDTAKYRLTEWVEGTQTSIMELEEERLHFEGPYPMPAGSLGRNLYHRIVTAGNLS
jgi:hypothetical protein